jgi:hypothetical protein
VTTDPRGASDPDLALRRDQRAVDQRVGADLDSRVPVREDAVRAVLGAQPDARPQPHRAPRAHAHQVPRPALGGEAVADAEHPARLDPQACEAQVRRDAALDAQGVAVAEPEGGKERAVHRRDREERRRHRGSVGRGRESRARVR